MCGFIVISSCQQVTFPIKESLATIKHRGPDDTGIYVSPDFDCHLGHVRLSILDLSQSGHQPMEDSSGRYILVFNGEIYNFKTLKENLENEYGNIQWKSGTDTEVILEGFLRKGTEFFSLLNGVFAFSLYDKKEKYLYVLRDPMGVKPLYYTHQNGNFLFCSELKGLLVIPNLKCTIRRQSLADQLALMYVPEPYTMYNEFYKVNPGILYTYQNGVSISQTVLFTHLNDKINFSTENEMIECFSETFSSAVHRQLLSDVPLSLLLSGGLDSSAVAYEAIKSGANIKKAYTISFSKDDSKYDYQSNDLYYAKRIAKKFGLDLEVINAKSEFISLLPSLIAFLEDGISDPAAINTFLICEQARADGIKVMLSGQGADEYLGGYRRYRAEKLIGELSGKSIKLLSDIHEILPTSVPGIMNSGLRRLKKFTFSAKQERKDRFVSYYTWGDTRLIQNLFIDRKSIFPGNDLELFFEENKNKDSLEMILLADQKFDLRSLNLSYSDKMSMAVGVEARVPFLDLEMVRLMNSLPNSILLKRNNQKYILKQAMENKLPREIIYRKKAGFALPIRSWFKNKSEVVDYYFNSDRIRKQGIFDFLSIERLLNDQFTGKTDNSYLIFSMLCQQIWLDAQSNKKIF